MDKRQEKNNYNSTNPTNGNHTDLELDTLSAFQSVRSQRKVAKNKGPYILGETLGQGAFAKVKVATHIHTREQVAIKILDKTKMLEDEDDIKRVQKEINILKKLRHKNIIQLYEIMESKKNLYIVMEYCEGRELFDYIVMKKRLTEMEACKFFQEIIDGVEYLHQNCIVHRDLKPENLLLDYKKTIKISDFGLSTSYNKNTTLSTPCGTPSYAPPEMLRGEEYHGLLSDMWSCGIILYAMLCGYLPFSESKEEIICQKIMDGDYEMPDYLSKAAVDLLTNILKIDPSERYDIDRVKSHPWFNLNCTNYNYNRPSLGITIGIHKIPIDENILDMVEEFGYDRNKCRVSLENNKYDSITSVYYLCVRKYVKEGGTSVSDLYSDEYIHFVNNPSNFLGGDTILRPIEKAIRDETEAALSHRKNQDSARNSGGNGEEIKVNVNVNLNVNLNTTNNIKISPPPRIEVTHEINSNNNQADQGNPANQNNSNNPALVQALTQGTHKPNNSSNIGDTKNSKLKAKLKEYSLSIASPVGPKETAFSQSHVATAVSSNKNSFLAGSFINKKEKKVTVSINNTNINSSSNHNTLQSPLMTSNNSHLNKNEGKSTILKQNPNYLTDKKPLNSNKPKGVQPQSNKKSSNKNLALSEKKDEKEFSSRDGSHTNLINNSCSINNLSEYREDMTSGLLSRCEIDDDLFDDDLNRIDNLGGNVLEFIARKLCGESISQLGLKKDSKRKTSNTSIKSNNSSFATQQQIAANNQVLNNPSQNQAQNQNLQQQNHNRSASHKLDNPDKTFAAKKLNTKKVQSADEMQFENVISLFNKKYKLILESRINEGNITEAYKDNIVLSQELLNNNINNNFIHKISQNVNQSNNSSVIVNNHMTNNSTAKKPQKSIAEQTLKNSKANKFNKLNNNGGKFPKKNYKNEEELEKLASQRRDINTNINNRNKFLDISATFDPDLDSRNDTSVDRSSSKNANLRNLSFSPDVSQSALGKFRSANNPNTNSFAQSILKKTKREINLNLNNLSNNFSSPVNKEYNKGLTSVSNKQSGKMHPIGVISEDDEFNNNFNVSVIRGGEDVVPTSKTKPTTTKKNKNINYHGGEKRVTINLNKDKEKIDKKAKNDLKLNDTNDLNNQSNISMSSLASPTKFGVKNIFSSKNSSNNSNNLFGNKLMASGEFETNPPKTAKKPIEISKLDISNININNFQSPGSTFQISPNKKLERTPVNNSKEKFYDKNKPMSPKKPQHRKTTSAVEFTSTILTDNNNEFKHLIKTKHQRNKSQVDNLNGINTGSKFDNSSFLIKNSNEVSLINFLNKNEDPLFWSNTPSQNNIIPKSKETNKPFPKLPNLPIANIHNLHNDIDLDLDDLNTHIYNTERGGKDQNIETFLDEFYRKPAVTGRSHQRSKKSSQVFDLVDKDSERLKTYTGPVDIQCVTNLLPCDIIEKFLVILAKKRITYVQTTPYKLRGSKIGISFDIEVFKLEESSTMNYLKFKLNQGDYGNYRKLLQSLLDNIKLISL